MIEKQTKRYFTHLHKLKIVFHSKFLLILFFALFSEIVYADLGKYPIDQFSPLDYHAGTQNIDFAQNRSLTLFVANNLGVLSFDGSHWSNHDVNTGKKKRSLAFDPEQNRLYVGSQGDFGYFEGNWNYVSLTKLIPEEFIDFDDVWDVYIVEDKVYFCTFRAIFQYSNNTIQVISSPEQSFNLSFQAGNRLFTQDNVGQLYEINREAELVPINQLQQGHTVSGVVPTDDGLLIIYQSGLIELSTPYLVSQVFSELSHQLASSYINHVQQLNDGRLAIATQTNGLFLFNIQTGEIEQIDRNSGLQSNSCLTSFQDYQGNLWVGLQNGMALVHINSPMRIINQQIALEGSGYDVFERDEGTYYTTSNGIYFLAKGADKSKLISGTSGPAYGLQEIAGKLYSGHHRGLFLLQNGQANFLAPTNGLWSIKLLKANPRYALAGTYTGLYLFEIGSNQIVQPIGSITGFDQSSRFFEEDGQGQIWVGQYYKGLFKIQLSADFRSATSTSMAPEYPELNIQEQVIVSSIDDKVVIGTATGVVYLNEKTNELEPLLFINKVIGPKPIYLLTQDFNKNIFVISDEQVGFFKKISKDHYQFVPSSLQQLKYFFNNDLIHASVHDINLDYFSANEGFIRYNPVLETQFQIPQQLIIKSIYSYSRDSVLYAQLPFEPKPKTYPKIKFVNKDKLVQFTVETDAFEQRNDQEFRYMLSGFDETYGEWTSSNLKEYTNLLEGNYELLVQSRNYLGHIITSEPFYIKVKPPFYRSLFAKIVYVLLFLGIGIYLYRYQKKKYQRRTQDIEERQKLELLEEQNKRRDIQEKKDQELMQLEEEKLQSELKHLNNLLAASTMNLVVKNEFIETIKEELERVKSKGKSPETKQALEKLVKEIDTTLRVQEDWEQFEYHFDQVHGDFLDRLRGEFDDLTTQDQKLCAYLRLNLNTKEIAQLLSISVRGVEVARYRLRKRLGLSSNQNLGKYILEY